MNDPIQQTTTDGTERCPNPRCRRALDAESLSQRKCQHCKCVLTGNQIARKYPRPPAQDDPAVALKLHERAEEIIRARGGRERLGPLKVGGVDRYVVLEAFVQSWESYFLKAGLITRQGRVRSGFAPGYLPALSQLMRLAQIIGLDGEDEKSLSPTEYLEAQIAKRQPHSDGDGADQTDDQQASVEHDS